MTFSTNCHRLIICLSCFMQMTKARSSDIGILYVITAPNKKKYVGITTKRRFAERMKAHQRPNACRYVSNTIQKYGWDTCTVETEEVPVEELNSREKAKIKELNTLAPHGLNLQSGGNRFTVSKATKRVMSRAWRKRWKKWDNTPLHFYQVMVKAKKNLRQELFRKKIQKLMKMRPVIIRNIYTKVEKHFEHLEDASKYMKTKVIKLIECAEGYTCAVGDYSVRFQKEIKSERLRRTAWNWHSDKKFSAITASGVRYNFDSMTQAIWVLHKIENIAPNIVKMMEIMDGKDSKKMYGSATICERSDIELHTMVTRSRSVAKRRPSSDCQAIKNS